MRFNILPDIFNKYESAQDELECLDEADYTLDREEYETQYYQLKAKFNEILHPVNNSSQSRYSSPRSSLSGNTNNSLRSHVLNAHIKLPTNALPTFRGDACSWLQYRDIFDALIFKNTALSNVQKFHYHIASN